MTDYLHDPAERLDYAKAWTLDLAEDEVIETATVTTATLDPLEDPPFEVYDDTATDDTITYWVRGGVPWVTYVVSLVAVTDQGRTFARTDRFWCVQR